MKNTIKVFGVIVLVVAIGFSMAGCSNSSNSDGSVNAVLEGNGVVWQSTILTSTGLVFKSGIVYGATGSGNSWGAFEVGTYTTTTITMNSATTAYTVSGTTLTYSGSATYTKKTGQNIIFPN